MITARPWPSRRSDQRKILSPQVLQLAMLVSAIAERPDQSRLSEELLLQLLGHSLQIAPKDVSGCHKLTVASLLYTELNDRAVDSQHYKLAVMGKVVPFFAGYYLYGEDKRRLRDNEEVYCLGNFGRERFIASLVIRKLGCGSKYERIGIVAQPLSSKVRVRIAVREGTDLADSCPLPRIVLV